MDDEAIEAEQRRYTSRPDGGVPDDFDFEDEGPIGPEADARDLDEEAEALGAPDSNRMDDGPVVEIREAAVKPLDEEQLQEWLRADAEYAPLAPGLRWLRLLALEAALPAGTPGAAAGPVVDAAAAAARSRCTRARCSAGCRMKTV